MRAREVRLQLRSCQGNDGQFLFLHKAKNSKEKQRHLNSSCLDAATSEEENKKTKETQHSETSTYRRVFLFL